ncbi:MAG: type II toxin-antitoxin system HicB family antitoxin [Candidatus Ratteibacteria bacterium]|nr:type II toxin-antitoxin system HicB family antitoxin [Candidatus Ratteibacteria bacterium]
MAKKAFKQTVHQYTAIFEPDEVKGGYTVTIPSLPGCISEGNTFEEALENIQEAAALYLEVMGKREEEIPTEDRGVIVSPVRVHAKV